MRNSKVSDQVKEEVPMDLQWKQLQEQRAALEIKQIGNWWEKILAPKTLGYCYMRVMPKQITARHEMTRYYAQTTLYNEIQNKNPDTKVIMKEQPIFSPEDLYLKLEKFKSVNGFLPKLCIDLSGARSKDLLEYRKNMFEAIPLREFKLNNVTAICNGRETALALSTEHLQFKGA